MRVTPPGTVSPTCTNGYSDFSSTRERSSRDHTEHTHVRRKREREGGEKGGGGGGILM